MSKVTFKLNEGVISTTLKYTAKELTKIALSPLVGGYENSQKIMDKIDDVYKKRGYYAAEQLVKTNTNNLISGYVELLKKVSVLGNRANNTMVGFTREKLTDIELDVIESYVKSYIEKKEKEYRNEIKRAFSFESNPPQFDSKEKLTKEITKELKQIIDSKYKSDNNKYYRLNGWKNNKMKVVGTIFPKLMAAGVVMLSDQWLELENKTKSIKGNR